MEHRIEDGLKYLTFFSSSRGKIQKEVISEYGKYED